MKFFAAIVMLIALKCNSKLYSEKDNFDIIEFKIDSTCSLSLLYFFQGDYMYRIGTMDSCPNLTKEVYIHSYRRLLETNSDTILIRQGKILFVTDFDIKMDTLFQQQLISITNKFFSGTGRVIEKDSERFTILLE